MESNMVVLNFEFDKHLDVRVPKLGAPYDIFAEWLFSDTQTLDDIKALKLTVQQAKEKVGFSYDFDGNAFLAQFSNSGVELINMHTDQRNLKAMSLPLFERVLLSWENELRE